MSALKFEDRNTRKGKWHYFVHYWRYLRVCRYGRRLYAVYHIPLDKMKEDEDYWRQEAEEMYYLIG